MSASPRWASLRRVREALLPPRPAPGGRVAQAVDAQAASALGWLGLLLFVQPLSALLAIVIAIAFDLGAVTEALGQTGLAFPVLVAVGLAMRAAARHPRAGRVAPVVMAGCAWVLAALLAWVEGPFRTDGGPSLMPLVVLFSVTVMPYRPAVAIGIALVAAVVYDVALLGGFTSRPLPAETRRAMLEATLPFEAALLVATAVVSSALHRSRSRSIRAALERDDLAAEARAQAEALTRANRELLAAQSELVRRRHLASLGNLVAGVSHELNNPTGALRGASDVLRRALDALETELESPSKKTGRALSALRGVQGSTQEAAERIARVVRSLRLFARLDEAEEQRVDLRDCVEAALERLAAQLEGRRVERRLGALPPVRCRPALMNEVFLEVLANAAYHAGAGGWVRVTTTATPEALEVEVVDSGPGIPEALRDQVFEPGFTTKSRGVGVGLGLSTAARILDEHGAAIEVGDGPDGGASFRIRFPVEPARLEGSTPG